MSNFLKRCERVMDKLPLPVKRRFETLLIHPDKVTDNDIKVLEDMGY